MRSIVGTALAGAILVSSTLVPFVRAEAQITEIASSVGVGELIDQIGDRLNGLIERAEEAGDFLGKRAGQEALYVLDAFERANQSLLDEAFSKIGEERQAILNQISKTADDIEKGRVDTLNRLEAISDQFVRMVNDRTFKQMPTIFRYRGAIVSPEETQDVRLHIIGYRLTNGTPHLIFRDQKYEAKKDGENLRFVLPRSLFESEDVHIKSEDATLVLEGREGGFLGLFSDPVVVEYELEIVTLPKHLATIELTYEVEVKERQERVVQIKESYNSSSRKSSCESYAYNPATKERRFDVEKSYVKRGSGNSRGKLKKVSIRDVGISFQICAKRGRFDKDNGYRHAVGRYVEFWTTSRSDPRNMSSVLTWTKNAAIPVEKSIDRLLITISDFSGVVRTVPVAGGKVGRYATVRYDAQSKVVIVDPIIPKDLEGL